MFGSWNITLPGGDRPKAPPRSPAVKRARIQSITHPRCLSLTSSTTSSDPPAPPDLIALLSSIRKPSDIKPATLKSLNVSYSYDVPLSKLIPKKYHPDETDENSIFNQRKQELLVSNQDATEFIERRRRDVKIGNFYKFYQTVDMIEMILSSGPDPTAAPAAEASSPSTDEPPKSPPTAAVASAGAKSSAKFREEMLRNFVDPIAWGYDMRIYPPRYPPRIISTRSILAIKVDLYLYLQPPTMKERKEGIIIGPSLVLQTRNEEKFTETDDIIDTMHEVAALINLAQERSKTGMFKKVRYESIGKEEGLDGDDLFLISSVNHHLSLSHVFLSDAYIRYLRTGKLPPEDFRAANPEWCACRVGKSKWYSLIEPEERVEALRVVMAVLAWLKRPQDEAAAQA